MEVLKAVNLGWKNYGLHSLPSGGASLAAYSGFSDRLFNQHRRGPIGQRKSISKEV